MCLTISAVLPVVNTLVITSGVGIGLFQYRKQQKFKRLQNLTSIWNKFSSEIAMLKLFELFDRLEDPKSENEKQLLMELETYNLSDKLRFLALLEEVAIYTESFEVDRETAIYLFQWHFKYVFINDKIRKAFWAELGGVIEIDKPYWSKSKEFAKKIPTA